MPGTVLGPCGDNSENQDRALGAQLYLMERYSCGPLSGAHFEAAIADGQAQRVADYLSGSWQICNNTEWCELVDLETYAAITKLTLNSATRFSETFDLAAQNGLASPHYALDRLIGQHPDVQGLIRFTDWVCGKTSATVEPPNFQGYGAIKFLLTKPASKGDLDKIKKVVLEVMKLASGKPIDPSRVEVKKGPTETMPVFDTHLPLKDGVYQTHEEEVPSVIIRMTVNDCTS